MTALPSTTPLDEEANAAWVADLIAGDGDWIEGIRSPARDFLDASANVERAFVQTLREARRYAQGQGVHPLEEIDDRWEQLADRKGLLGDIGRWRLDKLVQEAAEPTALEQQANAPGPLDRMAGGEMAGDEPPPPTGPEDYGLPIEAVEIPATTSDRPFALIDPTAWEGTAVPPRRWLVAQRIPAGNVTLLSGDGASGKTTIALQLAVAALQGPDWLGAMIETTGPVIFFSAEEDADELHRRFDAILKHHGLTYAALAGLHLHCCPGEDAVLGQPDRNGVIQSTALFRQLEAAARDIGAVLIVIEAAADVFAGNENDRAQVRQFIGLLRRLSNVAGAAVFLLAHPSLSGLSSGTGTSGSTAWNNSVRSRLYFASPKARGDDDADVRELRTMKANYGPAGEVVRLRWEKGLFIPVGSAPTIQRAATEAAIDRAFLECLDAKTAQGINVVHRGSANAAPQVFEAMPQAQGFKRKALGIAMERLLNAGVIVNATYGPPSKQRSRLARSEPQQ